MESRPHDIQPSSWADAFISFLAQEPMKTLELVLLLVGAVLLLAAHLHPIRIKIPGHGDLDVGALNPRRAERAGLFLIAAATVIAIGHVVAPHVPRQWYAPTQETSLAIVQPGGLSNGEPCTVRTNCKSGYCYPAPHSKPEGAGVKLCMARGMNCALPKLDGAKYGTSVMKDGQWLTCRNPGGGRSAQFTH